jgi:hypothetical protein
MVLILVFCAIIGFGVIKGIERIQVSDMLLVFSVMRSYMKLTCRS